MPRRALFVCLVLVTALGALDQTIVATALPAVVADLGAPCRAPWVVTAYTLALAAAMPTFGALGDRFGRRRMLIAAIAVFVAASAACGLSGDLTALAAARLVQGIGGAGLLTLPQAVVADAVPPRERAAYLGPLGAVFALATVVSPLLGGWLTDHASWRWIFWLNVPLGLAAAVLVRVVVPRRAPGRPAFDTAGAVLLAATTAGLVVSVEAGTGAAAAATGLLAFATWHRERRAAEPVLPVALLGRQPALSCCLLALLGGVGLFGVLAYVPTWIQGTYATSATTAGLMLLPVTLGIALGMNGSGFAVRRRGVWRPFPLAGCALSATSAAALALLSDARPPLPVTAALLFLLALGAGLFLQIVVVVAQDAGAPGATGKVTAAMAFVREIGVVAGAAGLGALVARGAGHGGYGAAFTTVFAVVAACFACGFGCALRLPRRPLRASNATSPQTSHP
ncbi:MFS transporter [Streptomyces sp. NPDC004856]|uniref:MFS transporter n=2 Tax=unclassified Streptomyces TaxID=2593676 RepID=UPI0033B5B89D